MSKANKFYTFNGRGTKMRNLFLSLLILLGACAQSISQPTAIELIPFYNAYKAEMEKRGIFYIHPTNMSFDDLGVRYPQHRYAGVCLKSLDGTRHIYLDAFIWSEMDDRMRWFLVLHEQGHCSFGFEHTPDIVNGVFSIMAPAINWAINEDSVNFYWKQSKKVHDDFLRRLGL